jgi:hypothetical protein
MISVNGSGDTALLKLLKASPTVETITALLDGGADANLADDSGLTPLASAELHTAAPEVVELLTARSKACHCRPDWASRHLQSNQNLKKSHQKGNRERIESTSLCLDRHLWRISRLSRELAVHPGWPYAVHPAIHDARRPGGTLQRRLPLAGERRSQSWRRLLAALFRFTMNWAG